MLCAITLLLCILGCQAQPGELELVGCDNFAVVCYEPCGCFNNSEPFEDRPLPQHPNNQTLEFDLYTPEQPDIAITIVWNDDVQVMIDQLPATYDNSLETKFMVHGWVPRTDGEGPPPEDFKYCPNDNTSQAEVDFTPWLTPEFMDYGFGDIKDALLERYDYNVFIVQWREGAGYYNYGQSASNAQVAGACSAHFGMRQEVTQDAGQLHCMGHSLGGQVCGYMGHYTDGTMGRLTGLDPAGPAFDKWDPAVRIDRTDAGLVDNIYTNVNSSSNLITLGMGKPVGHKDFYPNGGGRQPHCNNFYCDHQAPTEYYYASIDTNCTFLSFPCAGWDEMESGECLSCAEGNCQTMGYYVDEHPGEGTFYLETVENYPHCMASSGSGY